MRYLTLLLTLFILNIASAQNFEGSIHYDIKVEGLSDKQMQQAGGMMPSGYVFSIYKNKMRLKLAGGMLSMLGEMLIFPEKKETYLLVKDKKIAYKMPYADDNSKGGKTEMKIEKTNETKSIAGYTCKKIIISEKNGSNKSEMWVTNEITMDHKAMLGSMSAQADLSIDYDQIGGAPLEITAKHDDTNVHITATKVTKGGMNNNDFIIPSTYKVEAFDPMSLLNSFLGE